jgi:hypothetical protein
VRVRCRRGTRCSRRRSVPTPPLRWKVNKFFGLPRTCAPFRCLIEIGYHRGEHKNAHKNMSVCSKTGRVMAACVILVHQSEHIVKSIYICVTRTSWAMREITCAAK